MVAGDNVLNAEEIRDGVVLGGTTLPGSTVTVAMGGRSYDAVVDEHGNWTVEIPSQHLPRGEMDVDFVATSVSPAGNVATSTFTLGIDTLTEASLGTVLGDDIANASEFASGIVLNGMAEPGSRVLVQVGDEMLETIAAQDGSWTVTFPPDAFPRGEYDLPVVVTSTDLAGNTARVVSTLAIDTEAPDPVYIES